MRSKADPPQPPNIETTPIIEKMMKTLKNRTSIILTMVLYFYLEKRKLTDLIPKLFTINR